WQVAPHALDRPGIGRQLGVVRARFPAEVRRTRRPEQRAVPGPAPRVVLVIAEEVRLLGTAHEEARLPSELLVQRGRGALHGPDDDKIRSMDHHPDDSPGLVSLASRRLASWPSTP